MNDIKNISLILSILFGSISAVCWTISAFSKVNANNAPRHDGWGGGSVQDADGNDVVQTLTKQSKWNKWAAIFAALTAISQVVNSIS